MACLDPWRHPYVTRKKMIRIDSRPRCVSMHDPVPVIVAITEAMEGVGLKCPGECVPGAFHIPPFKSKLGPGEPSNEDEFGLIRPRKSMINVLKEAGEADEVNEDDFGLIRQRSVSHIPEESHSIANVIRHALQEESHDPYLHPHLDTVEKMVLDVESYFDDKVKSLEHGLDAHEKMKADIGPLDSWGVYEESRSHVHF